MNTAPKTQEIHRSGDYSERLVEHYVGKSPKPRLAHYPRIKRHADDSLLSDELLFDLNALLLRLLLLQNECHTQRSNAAADLLLARDAAEAAVARFIAPHLRPHPEAHRPLIPHFGKHLADFENELKAYVLVTQLYRGVIPSKHRAGLLPLTADTRLVLRTLHAARTRLLECFQSLRRTHSGWLVRSMNLIK